MARIKKVRVWKRGNEARVYVHTRDGREGCRYLTDTHWHKAGEVEGELTEQEWQDARSVAVADGAWHTVYADQMARMESHAEAASSDSPFDDSNRELARISHSGAGTSEAKPQPERDMDEISGWLLDNMPES